MANQTPQILGFSESNRGFWIIALLLDTSKTA